METGRYILTYDQAYKSGIDQVGAKIFNVARCDQTGFQVPDGVALRVQAFISYLNGDELSDLFIAIEDFFGAATRLIVRSSALEEDTAEASFAGQYLSLICLNKASEIQRACGACWASYSSSNVDAYNKAMRGTEACAQGGMGLLIQKVVSASAAGVCFTKDPLTDRKNIAIINAVHGLGEALVAGEVVADQYAFYTVDKKIVHQVESHQTSWRSPESPQALTPLPQELQNTPVLSPKQIAAIARMAEEVMTLFSSHQDIEWAYEGDTLFLLQARPITKPQENVSYELWTRDNVADVIPDAVTPLTWSIVNGATNNGFKNMIRGLGFSRLPATLFKIFDGRVYFNQTAYQGVFTIGSRKFQLLKIALSYLRLLLFLKKQVSDREDAFGEDLQTLSVNAGVSTIRKLKILLNTYMSIHIRVTVMMELGFLVIRKLIGKHVPENEANVIVDGLVTGLNEIESTASGNALWALACSIQENQELTETILHASNRSAPDILKNWGGVYGEKWQQFLDSYGHASLKEFEIYYPRWAEDQSFIIALLKQYIRKGANIDPETNSAIRVQKRMEAEEMLLKRMPPLYHLPLKFYIRHARQCSIWRESIKQKLVRIMAEIRKQVLIFADNHAITPSNTTFFFELEELGRIEGYPVPHELLEKATERHAQWEQWEKQRAFKEIRYYADGRQMKSPYLTGTGDTIQGLALSAGKYTGPARIILDPTQMSSFNCGDILVAPSTNPSWTPIFTLAGAIVTDMGNYLSHGAIVARELGIPAVGNLLDATTRIKDGQIIEVDGHSGTVSLSERMEHEA